MVENMGKHVGNKALNKQRKVLDSSLEHSKGADSITINIMETLLLSGYKHPLLTYHKIQLVSSTKTVLLFCCN